MPEKLDRKIRKKLDRKIRTLVDDPLGAYKADRVYDTYVGDYGWDNGDIYILGKDDKMVPLRKIPKEWYKEHGDG